MGNDLNLCEAQTRQELLKVGVNGLPCLFGLGVDHLGAVHAAGTDAHHNAVVVLQQFLQTNVRKEEVLCGSMAAGEDDQIGLLHEFLGLLRVAAVQFVVGFEHDAGVGKVLPCGNRHGVGKDHIIRCGSNEQGVDGDVQSLLQLCQKAVGGV